MLCLMVYEDGLRGDYRLVELEAPKPTLEFEKCCVKSMKQIEHVVDNTKLLGPLLCIAQVVQIFASHTRTPGLVSELSAAYNTAIQTDFKLLAEAMLSLSIVERKSIYNIAAYEVRRHIEDNKHELRSYWERIRDASV
jgi:hypothetical protein